MDYDTRILHIDDDENNLFFTKTQLEEQNPTFDVTSVESPFEALRLIKEEEFDCIICDYVMPGMNGITLGEKVRSLVDTPFVLFTGRGSEEVAERAFEAGIDDYIRKEATLSNFSVLSKRVLSSIGRHKAERELHRKEEELSWLVDNSIDAIFRIEYSKGITRYNPAFLRMFGLRSEELEEDFIHFHDFIHEEDRKYFREQVDKLIAGNFGKTLILNRWQTHNGDILWLESTASLLKDEGDVYGIEVITRDVTERVEMTTRLEQSEAAYKSLFDNMEEAVIQMDKDGYFTMINPYGAKLFGYSSPKEMINGLVNLRSTYGNPSDAQTMMNKVASTKGMNGERAFVKRNGEEGWLSFTGTPRFDNDGELLGFEGIIRDVTAEKQYERQLETLIRHSVQLETVSSKDELVRYTFDAIKNVLGHSWGSIGFVEDDVIRFSDFLGPVSGIVVLPLDGPGITIRALRTGESQIVNDIRRDTDHVHGGNTTPKTLSELAVPIIFGDKRMGTILIGNTETDAFSKQDARLLELLSSHIAAALKRIENLTYEGTGPEDNRIS